MRRMGIGLGVGINRSNYAQGIFSAYQSRVTADGGVTEAGACVDAVSSLLQSASLLLIPSGYKGGKAYAEIPTNGNGDLTWTRASDAWRTNADGLIQRVPWNLLQQSETFSNATWTKNNTIISADSIIAPNGTLTADKLVETATSSTHWVFQSTTYTATSVTVSCYMKKGERNFGFIRTRTTTTDLFAWFNLNTGVVGTVESGITASITNVGDGWYRCVVVNPNPTTSANPSVIGLSNADNVSTYTGDGTSGIYIWGAQLVEGSSAQTYFPTTDRLNVPRLSYMYGSCPALLLEPQRTNLALQSNTFNTTWSLFGGATITSNSTTSPDGSTNATTLNSAGGGNDFLFQSLTTTVGSTYTTTLYVKNINSTQSRFWTAINASPTVDINWSGSTITSIGGTGGTYSFTSVGNGWYRVVAVFTSTISSYVLRIYSDTLNSSKSIYIYGAQVELGAYPTTYIPTTTASATRIADTATKTGISSVITSPQGTLFVNCRALFNGGSFRGISISDGTYSNRLAIVQSSASNTLLIALVIGNTFIVNQSITGYTQTNFNKVAVSWGSGTLKVFVNGSLSNTFTSITMPSANLFTRFGLDAGASASEFEGFVQSTALFATPLSDSQCISLTT